jgi:hypothetical protein
MHDEYIISKPNKGMLIENPAAVPASQKDIKMKS